MNNNEKASPFFIVGAPRSGTTLLERLLNRHSDISIPPETAFFFLLNNKGYLAQKFTETKGREAIEFYLSRRPARLLKLNDIPDIRERLTEKAESYKDIFINLMRLITEREKSLIGEKTPHHLRCINYITDYFPDSRIVAIVRDGRAVVKSQVRHPNWGSNLLMAAKSWKSDMHALKKLKESDFSGNVLLISYENLLLTPEDELKKICGFIGVDFQETMLHADENNVPEKYKDYYSQSWMKKSKGEVDRTRIDAWKKEYSDAELTLVQKIISDELVEYGYFPERRYVATWIILLIQEFVRSCYFRIKRNIKSKGNNNE